MKKNIVCGLVALSIISLKIYGDDEAKPKLRPSIVTANLKAVAPRSELPRRPDTPRPGDLDPLFPSPFASKIAASHVSLAAILEKGGFDEERPAFDPTMPAWFAAALARASELQAPPHKSRLEGQEATKQDLNKGASLGVILEVIVSAQNDLQNATDDAVKLELKSRIKIASVILEVLMQSCVEPGMNPILQNFANAYKGGKKQQGTKKDDGQERAAA